MNDRIKLAEAMGWTWETPGGDELPRWCRPDGSHASPITVCREKVSPPAFNPFTDANDDYAVLEWMRNGDHSLFVALQLDLTQAEYQIGDYARAALKVMSATEQEKGDE